ncbi:MAG TPA: hypothetical protein VF487_15640 [Chitinophagaceae bacterium]
MEKDEIRAKMDKLITQIKAYIKASDFVVKQFKKRKIEKLITTS